MYMCFTAIVIASSPTVSHIYYIIYAGNRTHFGEWFWKML